MPSVAAEIVRGLPAFVVKVGVFVNSPAEMITRCASECGLNMLQFHGDETPEFCRQFGLMSMKAFRMRNESSLGTLTLYHTDAWLLDAFTPGKLGGTGEVFNWDLAVQAREMGRPVFLAGGLTPENVHAAIQKVRPYGVDVSSGVEAAPGKKDQEKIKRFIRAAKQSSAL
jgi:phosphoribosylanthranilate isomerase